MIVYDTPSDNLYNKFPYISSILHACIMLVTFIADLYSLDKPKPKITCTI